MHLPKLLGGMEVVMKTKTVCSIVVNSCIVIAFSFLMVFLNKMNKEVKSPFDIVSFAFLSSSLALVILSSIKLRFITTKNQNGQLKFVKDTLRRFKRIETFISILLWLCLLIVSIASYSKLKHDNRTFDSITYILFTGFFLIKDTVSYFLIKKPKIKNTTPDLR